MQDGHLPCLAHVIQLALSELLGKIRIKPTNEELQKVWTDSDANELKGMSGVPWTLAKVRLLYYGDHSGDIWLMSILIDPKTECLCQC